MIHSSRRTFVRQSLNGLGGLAAADRSAPPGSSARPLNVVCVGAHPDDPETGCGGTLAAYAELGHRTTIVYLTRGERGIPGKSLDEAAAVRTKEADEACRILGARAVFAGQIDGATELSGPRAAQFAALLVAEKPDVVFAQWPLDTHPDHQVAAQLTLRAWLGADRRFALYFFEVDTGHQSLGFAPTDYVDVTGHREKKKASLLAHRSQHGDEILRQHVQVMEAFRGREAGVAAAEAFSAIGRRRLPPAG
jgi:LmbE family N-acetylglucosaminyl deacetylase